MTNTMTATDSSQEGKALRDFAEIESAALQLEPIQRLELVRSVAKSLDAEGEFLDDMIDGDPNFWAEIERRVQDVREGKVVLRDGPTVMKELLARYS